MNEPCTPQEAGPFPNALRELESLDMWNQLHDTLLNMQDLIL